MSHFPWLKIAGITVGFIGFGYGLMKATTPTEEQLYKELAPDLKRRVDASRAARLAREAEKKRLVEAEVRDTGAAYRLTKPYNFVPQPDSVKPIWADPNTRN
ncbi:hypothetical protein APHAL10511_007041 [Amanita phalloides]|nr:hypothetical protein APHAL10511_007041 [Amanita phalloides]